MRKLFFILIFLFNIILQSFATHNRAGEITYRHISELTYEITIVTYCYTISAADRGSLEIDWGDNTSSVIYRVEKVSLPDNYVKNTYVGLHTYSGTGIFQIVMIDFNRNQGVVNIPGSVNVPFALRTILQINPMQGFGVNNTPILLNEPIDKAATNEIFIHNPSAYDPDGDSLSYELTTCLGANGEEIENYSLPETSNSFYVDEITGDLIWDTPTETGIYNVAILIKEWRFGIPIGSIVRDMQIEVYETKNNPPEIRDIKEICVKAGDLIKFEVFAKDIDNQSITLSATGGVFQLNDGSVEYFEEIQGITEVSDTFRWFTNCEHVRSNFYQVTFKATDNDPGIKLSDIENVMIKVIAPAPKNLIIEGKNNSIEIEWDKSICDKAIGYKIYRRYGFYGFVGDICENGVPEYTDYELIKTVNGLENTDFIDNNDGNGLIQGYLYCYMITAFFQDAAESYASEEICTELVRGIPLITNVSVRNTSKIRGSIYMAWSKSKEFDTIQYPGPYDYVIKRSEGIWGGNLQEIAINDGINDTIFIDTMLNTKDYPYSYSIEFYNKKTNERPRTLIGIPQIASSVYLKINSRDNENWLKMEKNVPWLNEKYFVYMEKENGDFDSISFTDSIIFVDKNLPNGKEFCYKVKSFGHYQIENIIDPIENFSQINCGTPIDTFPPCPPELEVYSFCDTLYNFLNWTNPNEICDSTDDVISYNIYYSNSLDEDLELFYSINNEKILEFEHFPELTLAACYAITAVDSFQNESAFSVKTCVDSCIYYKLPNVFSPNDDGINDLFIPYPFKFVEKIEMKIFNRWGKLVFKTDDPEILWKGNYLDGDNKVPDGVYYYICDVYERRLTGIEVRAVSGFLHLFGAKNKYKN